MGRLKNLFKYTYLHNMAKQNIPPSKNPLKTSEKQRYSNVFRRYRNRTLRWNGLSKKSMGKCSKTFPKLTLLTPGCTYVRTYKWSHKFERICVKHQMVRSSNCKHKTLSLLRILTNSYLLGNAFETFYWRNYLELSNNAKMMKKELFVRCCSFIFFFNLSEFVMNKI